MDRPMMDRRTFLGTVGVSVLAAPLAADAQHVGKVYRIGLFHVGDHIPPALHTLRDGLSAKGYQEGRNIQLDFRNLADEAAAGPTAREFARAAVI